jgi:copper chaperone
VKKHRLKFKQENILCQRCFINAVKALSCIPGIEEFSIDINTKIVKVVYSNNKIPKELIREAVNYSIVNGKIIRIFRNYKDTLLNKRSVMLWSF